MELLSIFYIEKIKGIMVVETAAAVPAAAEMVVALLIVQMDVLHMLIV